MKRVYLDHNATTPLRPEARAAFEEALEDGLANPSSLHASGRRARALVDEARERVARTLGVADDEVVFTSGATEANNLALLGALEAAGEGAGLLTTGTEHASVLEPARAARERGFGLQLCDVDRFGFPDLEDLERRLRSERVDVVSIALANGENGAVPAFEGLHSTLDELGEKRPIFHTDGAQALGRVCVDLSRFDLASFSAHKLGGPAGVGVLWRRAGTPLRARTFGGGQEQELRPGTENVAAIHAASIAIELAGSERAMYAERTEARTRALWTGLQRALPEARLVGPPFDVVDEASREALRKGGRLPNTLCFSIPKTDGRVLVTRLDLAGLEASAGSACASGSAEPSHVLQAMGYGDDDARSALRLSLGWNTTRADCEHATDVLEKLFAPTDASRATS